MGYGNLADSLAEEVYQRTSELSDVDFCDCLGDIISSLQNSIDAKEEEIENEK